MHGVGNHNHLTLRPKRAPSVRPDFERRSLLPLFERISGRNVTNFQCKWKIRIQFQFKSVPHRRLSGVDRAGQDRADFERRTFLPLFERLGFPCERIPKPKRKPKPDGAWSWSSRSRPCTRYEMDLKFGGFGFGIIRATGFRTARLLFPVLGFWGEFLPQFWDSTPCFLPLFRSFCPWFGV